MIHGQPNIKMCREAVLQSTPKGLLFFTYALAPKLSGIYVHVLSSDNVTTTSDVRTAQGPLWASFILNFNYHQSLWFKPVPAAVRSAAARLLRSWVWLSHRSGRQPKTCVKSVAAITVFELLMMGGVSPETC
jgi:hypothetical protein